MTPVHSAARFRAWKGPTLLNRGFRPFFLAAGVWALLAMALWLPLHEGEISLPTAFSPIDWHAHELLFGYAGAVVAGFLLTAIPNWTGRLPVIGAPLAGLAALWLAGRLAVAFSAWLGAPLAGAIDVAFYLALAAVVVREVVAGGNKRNYVVAGILFLLALVDAAFHLEAARRGTAEYSQRAALATLILLILLIGGRVTPSFTANFLKRAGAKTAPAPFDRFDGAAMAVSAAALAAWVGFPEHALTGALALVAGLADFGRLSRWRGLAARRDALLLALHAAFALAALGFLFAAAHAFAPALVPYAAPVHAWAVGAVGMMTLAMMTRATLGHSGHALVATAATKTAYVGIFVTLVARLALAFLPGAALVLMHVAACAWLVAFVAFVYGFAPMLARAYSPAKG